MIGPGQNNDLSIPVRAFPFGVFLSATGLYSTRLKAAIVAGSGPLTQEVSININATEKGISLFSLIRYISKGRKGIYRFIPASQHFMDFVKIGI